jgi:ribonuclease III
LLYNVILPKETIIHIKLFREAMTHRSYLVRNNKTKPPVKKEHTLVKLQNKSNERLRFLGDAIIHFLIGEFLYGQYPKANAGFLTRLRCKLENRASLFYLAKQTDIGPYILISHNIEALHGRNNINIIGGGFEAFVGALYLEMGLGTVRQFVLEIIRMELDINKIAEKETNYKELILQLYNTNHWGRPEYKIIKEEGPDHCKMFTMGLYLFDKLVGKGTASAKRKAEQIASKRMYQKYLQSIQ